MQESHQTAKQMEADMQKNDMDISSLTKKNEELVSQLKVQILKCLNIYRVYVTIVVNKYTYSSDQNKVFVHVIMVIT